MDKTPIHDPSMTPSASNAATTTGASVLQPKAMVYVCGECHKDNELKSTDVIRCMKNKEILFIYLIFLFFFR